MIRTLPAGLLAVALGASAALGQNDSTRTSAPGDSATAPADTTAATAAATPTTSTRVRGVDGQQVAVLETSLGRIVIRFFDNDAPRTVANFKKLVRERFYNGTYFHRVISRFMIQGGDPNTKNASAADDGLGSPNYTVPAEIKRPHLRGSVATARQGDTSNPTRASSGSQFFIDLAPQPSLDRGGYTVFGEVISGMDVVEQIGAFGGDGSLPAAAGGGRNPGKRALILRATLEPLSKWAKP